MRGSYAIRHELVLQLRPPALSVHHLCEAVDSAEFDGLSDLFLLGVLAGEGLPRECQRAPWVFFEQGEGLFPKILDGAVALHEGTGTERRVWIEA
jgi:hypothetical protein